MSGEEPPKIDAATAARETWAEPGARSADEAALIDLVRAWAERKDAAISREAAFWLARPELVTIRQFALSRLASPWAVLGGVLARVVAATPATVCLPATVGGRGSLNLYIAFVGPSGGGKGIANAVAREVVVIPSPADESQVGTGEGLVHAFMRVTRDDDKNVVPQQYRTNVLLDVPEVDSIRAQAARQGATLLAYLRSAWSGETVGRSTADVTRNLSIPAHSYRLAMTVGVQPGRADALLNDSDGGTPQRFVWVPVIDPSIVDGIDEPAPHRWVPPRWRTGPVMTWDALAESVDAPVEMEVCDTARKEIRADRLARARGEGVALDGHAMLARLKIAAALAILSGSSSVGDEDWSLAAVVMEVSDQTREHVQGQLRLNAKAAAGRKGVFEAQVRQVADDATERRDRKAVSDRIDGLLREADGEGWVTESVIYKAFSGKRRDLVPDVLDGKSKAGAVDSKRGRKEGSRVWRIKRD